MTDPAPYVTVAEAAEILGSSNYVEDELALLNDGDLAVASDELDAQGPFIGARPAGQWRMWPRTGTPFDDDEVPDRVKRWVAYRSFQHASDETPAVRSESAGRVSVSYDNPKQGATTRRMNALLKPLQLPVGVAANNPSRVYRSSRWLGYPSRRF